MSDTFRDKFIKLASCFIPSSKRRRAFRSEYLPAKPLEMGTNSVFLVSDSGKKQRHIYPIDGIKFDFSGENNVVEIHENAVFTNSRIDLKGSNANIELGEGSYHCFNISTAFSGYQNLKIGNKFSCRAVNMLMHENYSSVTIGYDCMISSNVSIWATDAHALFNKGENKAYNLAKPIVIGDHVWLGYDVKIAKGVTIPDNSVVGMGAVVLGKFTEPNTIIAGNPAKVIKTNIDWDRDNAYQYNQSVSL